jgi:mevalonate kinase
MLLVRGEVSKEFTSEDLDKINRWAFFSEKFVHGSPSGIDNHVTTYGGAVVFQRGEGGKEETAETIPCPEIRALLVDTKVPRSTSAIIQKTNQLRQESPEVWHEIIDGIGTLVEGAVEEIRKNFVQAKLIRENHKLLQKLGVSHPSLDKIIDLAQQFGFAGKLTGAGGGGCAYIYIPDRNAQEIEDSLSGLKNSLTEAGFLFWDTKLGSQGVRSF